MRGIEDSRQRWKYLFHENNTPSDLRRTIKSEQGASICNDGLRSICWKAFLLLDNLSRTQWPQKISESRSAYVSLKVHFLKYIEHPDDLQSSVDPLADDEESPWQILRNDEQMRADISQDVDRCLQENFFFREPVTKAKMIDILFIYSKLNPDLGYRQGMHEILAPILWVVDRDAIDPSSLEGVGPTGPDDDAMLLFLDAEHIEHDAFSLFCSVMQNIRVYYEHNGNRPTNGQTDIIPIVHQCQHIHDDLLAVTDLELADHLQALEILPQIFLTRWMRLLFGREFPFQDVLIIWDLLFAEGLRSELIDFTCVAMLLRVRWELLRADSSGVLSLLLRYPSPKPHAPLSFVYDGIYLEQNPTPERGAFIISKYSSKPPDSSKSLSPAGGRSHPGRKFRHLGDLGNRSEATSPSRSPARNSPLSIEAFIQDVSKGIQQRTESWGVAKAVRGAVNEAKKNMQAIQSEHNPRVVRYEQPFTTASPEISLPKESNTVAQLKAKLEKFEERNMMLAKALSQAVNEIRSHMMSNPENFDSNAAGVVKNALANIQSVQTRLETPFGATADQFSNGSEGIKKGKELESPDETSKVSESDAPEDSVQISSGTSNPTTELNPPITEQKSKGMAANSHTHIPDPTTELNPPITEYKPKGMAASSHTHIPASMPLRHTTRPSLADSEFSWMLGGNRHASSFVSQASEPPEQTRHDEMRTKQNALFGTGGEDEQRRPSTDSDGLALSSLRGAKNLE